MKKSLFMIVALFLSTTNYAQDINKNQRSTILEVQDSKTILTAVSAVKDEVASEFSVPLKSPENGCYYSRPVGTYYGFSTNATYLYVPAFGATFVNRCSESLKPTSKWLDNSGGELKADENGNYFFSAYPNDYVYYLPQITADGIETPFRLGIESKNRYACVFDSIYPYFTHIDVAQTGFYSAAFSDGGYAFGSGSTLEVDDPDTGEQFTVTKDKYYVFFDKPIKPFYLTGLYFRVASTGGTFLADGVELKAEIFTAPDPTTLQRPSDAVASLGEKIASFTITKDNINSNGVLTVSSDEVDDIGNPLATILTEPFVVVISGFAQDGVDMGFLWTQPNKNPVVEERPFPTIHQYVKADGTPYSVGWRYFTSGRIDHLICALSGMWDVVAVSDLFRNMTAPVEGGKIATTEGGGESGTTHYASLQFRSTLPLESTWIGEEGYENYYIDEMPDWLTLTEVYDWSEIPEEGASGAYKYNYGFVIEAEPLPEGVEGREAIINIISDRGADSGPITIIQGNPVSGINEVTNEQAVTNNATFNLSGQQVGGNYRGIVIKNGKKVVRK